MYFTWGMTIILMPHPVQELSGFVQAVRISEKHLSSVLKLKTAVIILS